MTFTLMCKKVINYIKYHGYSKWNFVYLSFDLTKNFIGYRIADDIQIKEASLLDIEKIKKDIFPQMIGEQEYEKKYFSLLENNKVKCFICISKGKIVHYSWVFFDIKNSPIVKTPFNTNLLREGDVYIGPIFTAKLARGFIYPQVLSRIVASITDQGIESRIIVLVQGLNPSAVGFYKRMGFQVIKSPTKNIFFPRIAIFLNHYLQK
jgi:hypothetical protein